MVRHLITELPKWIFILMWLAGNATLFGYTFWKYHSWDDYYYLHSIVGLSVSFSRASAATLHLNLALILLPVCRNFISFLRGSCECSKRRSICRQLDKNISFHKLCGYTICFWAVIHYLSHSFNFVRFIEAAAHSNDDTKLKYKLSSLPSQPNGTWVNPVLTNDTNSHIEVLESLVGTTGVIAFLTLVLMVSSSMEYIRRNFFEVFWYTHHLFLVFFAVIIAHGCTGAIRKQYNLDEHNLTLCKNRWTEWNQVNSDGVQVCPDPQFTGHIPETWMWVVLPLTLYLIERLIRFYRRFQKVELVKAVQHPSRVLELQMRRAGFRMMSGQYIFVNCPDVSRLQWHPFTLTSAPSEDIFSVHIRIVGDWTETVFKACEAAKGNIDAMPRFVVDGPFGTCSEDVFEHSVAMLIGAGIGVTPFASILKHIWYMHSMGERPRLKKVYFYWVCPDTHAFSWFVDLLRSLEQRVEASDNTHFLDIQIYWTRGWTHEQANEIIDGDEDEKDRVTQLRHKTRFGRPDWEQIFSDKKAAHVSEKVGVFFCGPAVMSDILEQKSREHSSFDPSGTHFVYNKENF